jgi:drug/metabolite transporter (DMT)-like permease
VAALAILYVFLWASAFVPSKILAIETQPLWILVIRFLAAGSLLGAVVRSMRRTFPTSIRGWLELALLGALTNALYLGLNYLSLVHLSAGMGAIIASLNPIILTAFAPWLLDEPLTLRKALGMVLGFGGVIVMMIVRAGTQAARPADVGLASLGVLAFVFSTVLYKHIHERHDLLATNAAQLGSAGLIMIPAAWALEGPPRPLRVTPELAASLVYLILIISIGASFLWFGLLARGQATRVSAFYFLTPVFGLGLGALFLGEHAGVRDLAGLAMISAGIFLVQRS